MANAILKPILSSKYSILVPMLSFGIVKNEIFDALLKIVLNLKLLYFNSSITNSKFDTTINILLLIMKNII